ncbi:MAG: RNA-directed DNA polymerase [Ruminococcus flavefaciens]|nr:RNA-directed DNA polymerase [Ruminococcus flavefaciens]
MEKIVMLVENTSTKIEVKTVKHSVVKIKFDDVFNMDTLQTAYRHVRRGKALREQTVFYHMNMMKNLKNLLSRLRDGTYYIGKLSRFKVYEPKEREVIADRFEDKIVQDIMAKKVLRPLLGPELVYDNYASQPNKGTHKALHRLERYERAYAKTVDWSDRGSVLVCDISKFFYTIDQEICWKLVSKLPIDERIQKILYDQITTCTPEINPYTELDGKGLCIGFQTSQWLAVYYLNKLDHYIKEHLRIKYYGRYMDDFYLIHESKEYLEYCFRCIKHYCKIYLEMDLNKKSYIHPFKQGICFLGYRVKYDADTHEVVTTIRRKSINKMLKRTKKQVKMIKLGLMTVEQAMLSLESWKAYAKHGDNEKAMNAYEKALRMLHDETDYLDDYRELLDDWRNLDEDNFFRLRIKEDHVLRDVDGYAILMKKKKSKREVWFDDMRERVQSNPERYMHKNYDIILNMSPDKWTGWDKPKKPNKGKKRKVVRNRIEAATSKMRRPE